MASQHPAGGKRSFRHRLKGIHLEPSASRYDVAIELFTDEKKVRKLPTIKSSRQLHWDDLSLPCDVCETSTVTIRITEIHTFRDLQESVTYHMSQVMGQDTFSIESNGKKYTVNLSFMGKEVAERAYREAFNKAQQIESRPSVVQKSGRAGAAFKTLLALGSTMAELDPTGGAKVAFAVCTQAWEHGVSIDGFHYFVTVTQQRLEQQDQQDADINNFVENLAGMIPSIESVERLADARLAETVLAMLNLVEDASLFVLRFKSRNPWARALYSAMDSTPQEEMQELVVKFERLRKEFDTRVNVQTFETTQIDSTRSKLQELKPVRLAGYDSTRACMPETRVAIIHDITTWVCEQSLGQHLAWVHGLAGLGKSSIATSVCQQLDDRGMLGASFFCKRDNPELRDPCRVLTTVAYSLSMRWKPYGDTMIEVIRADPDLHSQHIRPLYDTLLDKPLRSLAEAKPPTANLVVVVDALDECGDFESRRQLLVCLWDMSQLAPWLKVVITSRPDVDIQEFFGQHSQARFAPYNVLSYDSHADIRVFVRAQLEPLEDIDAWPKDVVDQLSDRSSGLFIWARTACKYITAGHNPLNRLKQVLTGTRLTNSSAELDALYTTAIRAGAVDEDDDNLSEALQCLGVIVVTATRTPLSVLSLSKLLRGRIPQYTIGHVLLNLSSVLYLDHANDDAVRVSHPSFMDYITDRARSKEFCVDLDRQNVVLAECCLETMTTELRFNICNLETSHLLNRDVPNLDTRARNALGAHLSYSCVYWTSHLVKTGGNTPHGPLRAFLFALKALYWIEALSLLRKLSVAPPNLLEVARAPNIANDCQACAYDLYRFVLSFYDVISESTPHLYVSAIALAPEKSQIAQRVRHHFLNTFMVIEGAEQEWTPCLRTIWAHDTVNEAQFSPDGRSIAAASGATVRVWNAETGASLLEPLRGHLDTVWSVAFSPDGRFIASGSEDRTVKVWSSEAGATMLEPMRGHSDEVRSVAFSPNGRCIVSGSADRTVRVWDAETGTSLLGPLQGHSHYVMSVAFSPDSRRIISGSTDTTVRIWDAETGATLLGPLHGHTGTVCSVAFSPDGHHIASGSDDTTIRIWDAGIGVTLLEIQGQSCVWSLAFSPNGRLIVSGLDDCTVRVWDAATGVAIFKPLQGHLESVYSVGFSPDSRCILSSSWDKTLRIWDTEMSNAQFKPLQGHQHVVLSVAFSADNRRVVSSSRDTTMRIWDVETGNAWLEPLQGHSDDVWSVVFSPDSRRIVSGSMDKTVRIWDTETGATLLGPLQGHNEGVRSVAVSPDGHRIASGSDDSTMRIWDADTGVTLVELQGHSSGVQSVAFSPDGRLIFSGSSDHTIRIWDTETGSALREPLRGHSGAVWSVSPSPRGHCIASGSSDRTVRIWNTDTGAALLEPLLGHRGVVRSVAFSCDGSMIVSGAEDWTVRVWDAETGAELLAPLNEWSRYIGLGVFSVAFSPDGRRIVSGSDDLSVRIWDIDTCMRADAHSFLPGTQIPVLSKSTHSQPLLTSSILARHLNSNGWVTTEGGELILWLPPDLRGIDDSSVCISTWAPRRRMVMDFAKFVHGSSWSSVATM